MTGILLGFGLARMLVTVLTGVFDPPPEFLSIPWNYLGLLAVAALVSTVAAITGANNLSRHPAIEEMRNLGHVIPSRPSASISGGPLFQFKS